MKKIIIMLSAIATVLCASCTKSTFLGLETEIVKSQQPVPDPHESIENTEFTAQFDTTVCRLFTVEQTVTGDLYSDENVFPFAYELDVDVTFTSNPVKTRVSEEALLSDVRLTESRETELSKTSSQEGRFSKERYEKEYSFVFNADEVVTADVLYELLRCEVADTTFAFVKVKNVEYLRFSAKKNEAMSNDEVITFDINTFFSVALECDEKPEINNVYEVRVPFQRYIEISDETQTTVIEDKAYEAEFTTAVKSLTTIRQEVSGNFVTYNAQEEEVERSSFSKDLNLSALFSAPERVYVDSEDELTAVSVTASAQGGDIVSANEANGFTTTTTKKEFTFRFDKNEVVASATEFQALNYGVEEFDFSSIRNVVYKSCTATLNNGESREDLKVSDVTLYFEVEVAREGLTTKAGSGSEVYTVAVPYQRALKIEKPVDEVTNRYARDVRREIVDENTEKISWTEVTVWSVSGEKTSEKSFNLYRHFSAPQMQWIYTENTQYTTTSNGSSFVRESVSKDGNWSVTTRYMQYTSTANNNVNAFQNVYSYDFQKAVYVDEYYTLNFDYADWQITEGNTSVSGKVSEVENNGVVYNVYNYVNNINTVYSVSGGSFNASAKAEAKIAVEKPVEKVIPNPWGTILGAGISAVPSYHLKEKKAMKCLTIRTDKGAVAVIFEMSENVPAMDMILNGYFVEGNFSEAYNSGYWTTSANKGSYELGKWAPAIAKDESDRISYYSGDTLVANVKHTTLSMWNWRNGNNSTVVEGYTFTVSGDGVLTISLNGSVVMRIR